MVSERLWGIRSQHLALLFLAVVVPPIVALIWLGVQLVDQDRALWAQREEERDKPRHEPRFSLSSRR
jgi:hypothetical protein